MRKEERPFTDGTGDDLGRLYPIILETHDPHWKAAYARERDFLLSVFEGCVLRISHIGSTAVERLTAKPTVDILLEVSEAFDLLRVKAAMQECGYIVNMPKADIICFIKGYAPHGFEGQTYHIHVRNHADWGELYFRDYLRTHAHIAKEYANLKLSLQERYRHDRDGYTEAKGAFIAKHTALARAEFPGRYTPAHT